MGNSSSDLHDEKIISNILNDIKKPQNNMIKLNNLNTEENIDIGNNKICSIRANIKKLKKYINQLNSESPAYKINRLIDLQSKLKEISILVNIIEKNELTFKEEVVKSFDRMMFSLLINNTEDYESNILGLEGEINKYLINN